MSYLVRDECLRIGRSHRDLEKREKAGFFGL